MKQFQWCRRPVQILPGASTTLKAFVGLIEIHNRFMSPYISKIHCNHFPRRLLNSANAVDHKSHTHTHTHGYGNQDDVFSV